MNVDAISLSLFLCFLDENHGGEIDPPMSSLFPLSSSSRGVFNCRVVPPFVGLAPCLRAGLPFALSAPTRLSGFRARYLFLRAFA